MVNDGRVGRSELPSARPTLSRVPAASDDSARNPAARRGPRTQIKGPHHPGPFVVFARIAEGHCWLCGETLVVMWRDEEDDNPWGICEPCGRAFQVRGREAVERIDLATAFGTPGNYAIERLLGDLGRLEPFASGVILQMDHEDRVLEYRWNLDKH